MARLRREPDRTIARSMLMSASMESISRAELIAGEDVDVATIEIDDALLAEAMEVMGGASAKELVEKELRESLGYRKAQLRMREFRGKVEWDGDLDAMRRDR